MFLIERTRIKPILPKMPGQSLLHLMPKRIFAVCPPKSLSQRILCLRHHQKVDMVAHQAVTDHRYSMSNTRPAQNAQVDSPFTLVEKDRLSMISTLGNVVYAARNDDSCSAWHQTSSFGLRWYISGNWEKSNLSPI
jgi:hypothetical protein